MRKKILAGLLSLCMLFSLFPVVALADEPEEGPQATGSTIYVDAVNGDDANENVGTRADTAYKSLETAVNKAESGDTIVLAAGTYTLYQKGAKVLNKDLTFVGAGTDKTTWLIGPTVPDPAKFGTEYNSDYSFDVRSTDAKETVTFKNMTLQSGNVDYLGFAGTDNTVVENCVIDGKTFYWGYTSAIFKNTTFNCPPGDYAIRTYSSPELSFESCTFNSTGKIINVYTDAGAGKYDITVNFKNCTVKNTETSLKPVLNINDSNMGSYKYVLNISGNNSVSGVTPDEDTCSRLFGYGGKAKDNNKGKTVVTIERTKVWENGARVGEHGQDIAGGTYTNGFASGTDNKYTDGYKDNAFTVTEGPWTTGEDGKVSRKVTKTCDYCGDTETITEYKDTTPDPEPPAPGPLDVSKSKRATANLDSNYTTNIELSLPSAEENLKSDVVFVVDVSDCYKETLPKAIQMLKELQKNPTVQNGDVKYAVVFCRGNAVSAGLQELTSDTTFDELSALKNEGDIQNYITTKDWGKDYVEKGSNLHAGLLKAQSILEADTSVDNNRKYVVAVSDGLCYFFDDVKTVYAEYNKIYLADCLMYVWGLVNNDGDENWGNTYSVPDNFDWNTYYKKAAAQVEADGDTYISDYRSVVTTTGLGVSGARFPRQEQSDFFGNEEGKFPYIPKGSLAQHANSLDYSVVKSISTWTAMKEQDYNLYYSLSNGNAYGNKTFPYLFAQAMNNAGRGESATAFSFDSIEKQILYAVDKGSTVTDIIGQDFDVTDVNSFKLTVCGTELQKTVNGNTIYFGNDTPSAESYRFMVEYEPGSGEQSEQFIWTINEPVSNFAPVQLTYSVKLTDPKAATRSTTTYGQLDLNGDGQIDNTSDSVAEASALYTNVSAILTPVDSKGKTGSAQAFPMPSVTYTVPGSGGNGGGGGGGGGGGTDIPDDPTPLGPTPDLLNIKDHYGYIVGYPVDYYTGEPTDDQTKKPVRPEGDITRAEVATIFFRMLTDDSRNTYWSQDSGYSDVAKNAWYNNAVSTLSNAGVLKGYQDGKFLPNGKITRAEFATIATRFFEIQYNGPDFFSDVDGHWAQDYINQAASANLVNGYPDGTFGPQKNITRAEAMTLVNRILQRYPDKDKLLSDMLVWPDNMDTGKWYYADVQEATNSHDYKRNTDGKTETWTKLQPVRDWAAFEKAWSDANAASNPGEVVNP